LGNFALFLLLTTISSEKFLSHDLQGNKAISERQEKMGNSFISENSELFIDLSDEFKDFQNGSKKRNRTKSMTTEQWWKTSWGKMLKDEKVRDINTTEGKEFRRRFRVPAPFFLDWLVPEVTKVNIFDSKIKKDGDVMGHVPMEIKVLIVLRLLARGNVVDDIVELGGAKGTTVRYLFKTFVVNFAKHFIKKNSFVCLLMKNWKRFWLFTPAWDFQVV